MPFALSGSASKASAPATTSAAGSVVLATTQVATTGTDTTTVVTPAGVKAFFDQQNVQVLDVNDKVPTSQFPDALLGNVHFSGLWSAETNDLTLPQTPQTGTDGYYYIQTSAGTFQGLTFQIGDWLINNGGAWGKVDNTDAVQSVQGKTGTVTLYAQDISNSTATGRALLTQVDAAQAKSDLGLQAVATSGSYADLTNKPVISDITGATESDTYGNTTVGTSIVTGTGKSNTLFGRGAAARNQDSYVLSSNCVLLGNYATGNGDYSVVAGYGAKAWQNAVALGHQSTAGVGSISIGSGVGSNGFGGGYGSRIELFANNGNGYATCRLSGVPNGTIFQSYAVTDAAPTDFNSFDAARHGDLQIPRRMWGLRVNTAGKPILDINNGGTVTSVTIPNITGTTGTLYSNYGVSQTNNTGNYTNLFGNGLNGLGALKLNAHGSNHTYSSATVVTGASVFGDNISVSGSTLGEACAFGRNVVVFDGGAAFGAAANAALNGTAVGPYAHAGNYSLSLGYYASHANSVVNRTEIAPTNNGTITHRLSGQSNGAWQMTFPVTDTAPTTVTQAFGNANGTLPQSMAQLRVSTAGIPTIDQNVGGTITSTPVSHRQIVDINAQTGTTYTTVAADAGKVVTLNNASAITVTLSALPAGARCVFEQLGAGQVTFTAGSGNTIRHVAALTKIAGQWGRVWCRVSSNGTDYILSGDMA